MILIINMKKRKEYSFNMNNIRYLECDCGGEILRIERWDDNWELFTISWYTCLGKASFRQRIKWAWTYLTKGEFGGNEILVSADKLDELIAFLQEGKNLKEYSSTC